MSAASIAGAETSSGRGDQQDPQLRQSWFAAVEKQDASGALAVNLGDPRRFPGGVVAGGFASAAK